MATQLDYPTIAKQVIQQYQAFYAQAGLTPMRTLFDDTQKSYMLLDIGWYEKRYIHNATIHLEIIHDKIWVQNDDTEEGVATALLEAGVPHSDIVLGFRPPKLRPFTEFAAA